jgi:hypothetical protein
MSNDSENSGLDGTVILAVIAGADYRDPYRDQKVRIADDCRQLDRRGFRVPVRSGRSHARRCRTYPLEGKRSQSAAVCWTCP